MISKEEARDSFNTVGCTWQPGYPDPYYPNPNYPWYPSTIPSTETTTKIVFSERKEAVKIPELYPEDLDTLKEVMNYLDTMASLSGIYEIEIRVRLDDDRDIWAVLGYGESGDPCVLRFE